MEPLKCTPARAAFQVSVWASANNRPLDRAGEKRIFPRCGPRPGVMVRAKGLEKNASWPPSIPHRQLDPQVAAACREEQTKIGVSQDPRGTGLKIHSRDIKRRLGKSNC